MPLICHSQSILRQNALGEYNFANTIILRTLSKALNRNLNFNPYSFKQILQMDNQFDFLKNHCIAIEFNVLHQFESLFIYLQHLVLHLCFQAP